MIDCPCGNQTMPASAKGEGARLEWQECGACGRCGLWSLSVAGEPVASGKAARRAFKDARLLERIHHRICAVRAVSRMPPTPMEATP